MRKAEFWPFLLAPLNFIRQNRTGQNLHGCFVSRTWLEAPQNLVVQSVLFIPEAYLSLKLKQKDTKVWAWSKKMSLPCWFFRHVQTFGMWGMLKESTRYHRHAADDQKSACLHHFASSWIHNPNMHMSIWMFTTLDVFPLLGRPRCPRDFCLNLGRFLLPCSLKCFMATKEARRAAVQDGCPELVAVRIEQTMEKIEHVVNGFVQGKYYVLKNW